MLMRSSSVSSRLSRPALWSGESFASSHRGESAAFTLAQPRITAHIQPYRLTITGNLQSHRSEKAGGQERRIGLERIEGRVGDTLRTRLLVADHPVWPNVRHFHFHTVLARTKRVGN